MPLIESEINLQLKWSENCFLVAGTVSNQEPKFTDTKLYVPFVTLSTQDNARVFEQLESGFKRKVNLKNYSKKYFKLFAMDLNKKQDQDTVPEAIKQITFTANLEQENSTMFFIIEEFFKRNHDSIVIKFCFNIILI